MIVAWSGSGRTRNRSNNGPVPLGHGVICAPRLVFTHDNDANVYCRPIIPFPTGRVSFCAHSRQ